MGCLYPPSLRLVRASWQARRLRSLELVREAPPGEVLPCEATDVALRVSFDRGVRGDLDGGPETNINLRIDECLSWWLVDILTDAHSKCTLT